MAIPALVVLMFARFIVKGVEELVSRPAAGEPLCARCAFAHIEFRVNARRDLFCGVGGNLRKMRGVVSFCTSFATRVPAHVRGPVGFVQISDQQPALTGD